MRPYDLRRCYPRWLLEAGVSSNRAKMYQGNTTQDQTDTYAFHDSRSFLKADALLLQHRLAAQLQSSAPSPVSEQAFDVSSARSRQCHTHLLSPRSTDSNAS
jgi:hypothetical protein